MSRIMKKSWSWSKRVVRGCLHGAINAGLLAAAAALARALVLLPANLPQTRGMTALSVGFVGGVLAFWFVVRLPRLYVLGHELTHWLTALVFRRRTRGFRVGLEGGSVMVERPNMWIVLAPYFVPVYTLLWIGLYGFYRLVRGAPDPGGIAATVAYAGVGVTYAFHVVWTVIALRTGQSDLRMHGVVLSILLIVCLNLLFVYGGMVVATRRYTAGVQCLIRGGEDVLGVLTAAWGAAVGGVCWLRSAGRGGIGG